MASARTPAHLATLAAAIELYANRLLSDSTALEYLAQRGFNRALVERARVGYANGDELVPYLIWRGHSPDLARQLGLIRSNGREVFAGRVIVPEIRHRRPIWMIGRLIDPGQRGPKYLGLRGSKPLLGWDGAHRDLHGVCLVEGPMDLLALCQWGVSGLALCGTAVSPRIAELLARWERVYVALDSDAAGQEATAHLAAALGSRAIPVALPHGIKDPAELALLPHGGALFQSALAGARRES